MDKKITIVTHSGNFHADEILAVATLFLVLGENKEISVVRSREQKFFDSGDYVVDVGGIHDPDKNRFDHHQEGGAGIRQNTVPYASFGLVWKKYGQELSGGSLEISQKIDLKLVQPIDAMDNGLQFTETKIPDLYPYGIGDFFDVFKPTWKEDKDKIDEIFIKMVYYARELLLREIKRHKDNLEAKAIVENTYRESKDKRLIIFDRYYPYGEVLSEFPEPLFVVFPKDDRNWVLNTIRIDPNSFTNRKDLPKDWSAKRDEDLEKITGVQGAVFCHRALFTAVAKTKEAILQLAEIALKN